MTTHQLRQRIGKSAVRFEYHAVLFGYLTVRFLMKNVLEPGRYFTAQPVFGLPAAACVVLGICFLAAVCLFWSSYFGSLIRDSGSENRWALTVLTALLFACPGAAPFLFNPDLSVFPYKGNALSGAQMLYPFACFTLAVFLSKKRFGRWLIPLVCAGCLLPAAFTNETFFALLRNQAALYVPLLLLVLFLEAVYGARKAGGQSGTANPERNKQGWKRYLVFIASSLSALLSLLILAAMNELKIEKLYPINQPADENLLICLAFTAPLLVTLAALVWKASPSARGKVVHALMLCPALVLFPLFKSNYYGMWVPFLVLSFAAVGFYALEAGDSAALAAARNIGGFFSRHKPLFLFLLIATAALSNASLIYDSPVINRIFAFVPY